MYIIDGGHWKDFISGEGPESARPEELLNYILPAKTDKIVPIPENPAKVDNFDHNHPALRSSELAIGTPCKPPIFRRMPVCSDSHPGCLGVPIFRTGLVTGRSPVYF